MKKTTRVTSISLLIGVLTAAPALASNVGVGVNLNIGTAFPAPPPVVVPQAVPVPVPVPLVISTPPMFIAPPGLGISIAVGVPFDMFQVAGNFYVYRGNQWYCGPQFVGPWRKISHGKLPHQLRGHDIGHFRHVREREYRAYQHDHNGYRGRYYQAGREGGGRGEGRGRHGDQMSWNQGGGDWSGRSGGERHGEGHGKGGHGRD